MTKKKKLIIAAVSVAIILVGIILTIVLVSQKRYNNYTRERMEFNNHTTMTEVGFGTTYHASNAALYNNGTQVITDNLGKYGIYSYKENRVLLAPEYDDVVAITDDTEDNHTYFQLVDNDSPNRLRIVDERGKDIPALVYDETEAKTSVDIKTKEIKIKESWGEKKASAGKTFEKTKVWVDTFRYVKDYMGENYHYETWEVKTIDGKVYTNIYDMTDNRKLVQTMGIESGISYEVENPELVILTDGTIRFVTYREVKSANNDTKSLEYSVYDNNYNLKGTAKISGQMLDTMTYGNLTTTNIRVGNNLIFQTVTQGTERKYDFVEDSSILPVYCNYTTYKLNLNNGDLGEIKLNYLINADTSNLAPDASPATVINDDVTALDVIKIKDKKLDKSTIILVNNRMQTTEINYGIDTMVKITGNRFMAIAIPKTNDETYNLNNIQYNLIDGNFKLICSFGNIKNYFATNNSIIIDNGTTQYVTDMNGLVLKTYESGQAINIQNDEYYLVRVEEEIEGKIKTEYYLERMSERDSTPVYSKTDTVEGYTSGANTYSKVEIVNTSYLSLYIRVTSVGSTNYTYEICNFEGKVLQTIQLVADTAKTITLLDATAVGDDYAIVSFDGKTFCIDR